jgi:hypothetical protein
MIKFEGHSDDTIIWEDANGTEEHDTCADEKPVTFYVVAPDDKTMAVVAHYFATGCWCFAPGLYEEDAELPDWPIQIRRLHGYSVELLIDAPEGTVVTVAGDQ